MRTVRCLNAPERCCNPYKIEMLNLTAFATRTIKEISVIITAKARSINRKAGWAEKWGDEREGERREGRRGRPLQRGRHRRSFESRLQMPEREEQKPKSHAPRHPLAPSGRWRGDPPRPSRTPTPTARGAHKTRTTARPREKKQPPVRSAGSKPNTAARGGQRRAATIHQNKSRRNAEGPPETETPTPPNEQEERRRRCLRSTSSRDQKPQTGQKTREKDEGNEKAKQKCLMPKLRVPLRSEHAPGSCRPADVAARLPLPLTHAQLPTRRAALPDDPTGMGGRIGNAVRCCGAVGDRLSRQPGVGGGVAATARGDTADRRGAAAGRLGSTTGQRTRRCKPHASNVAAAVRIETVDRQWLGCGPAGLGNGPADSALQAACEQRGGCCANRNSRSAVARLRAGGARLCMLRAINAIAHAPPTCASRLLAAPTNSPGRVLKCDRDT